MKKAIQAITDLLTSKQVPFHVVSNLVVIHVAMSELHHYGVDEYDLPATQGFYHDWNNANALAVFAE